jgi:hypothetical protein
MSCRHKQLTGIHFSDVSMDFKPDCSAVSRDAVCLASGSMTRRRISSMPAGMVIAALAVIALVAVAALFLFGGSSEGTPSTSASASASAGPEGAGE